MLVIAHRGASGYAPEHTFAAYDLALEMGADYLEQDLQMTRDGVLVVLHDETLDRTTDCTGPVRAHTLAEVKECDERVPTLEEVFQRYGRTANYYIETKSPEIYPGMEEALLALLRRYGVGALVQSFSAESLRRMHALEPSVPLVQLAPAGHVPDLVQVAAYAQALGPAASDVDAELVAAAHAHSLAVHAYTVDDEAEMRRLMALGVDGMFTNFPDRLAALRRQ